MSRRPWRPPPLQILQTPPVEVGTRIQLRTYVERLSFFLAEPGLTGTIKSIDHNKEHRISCIIAEMDCEQDPDAPDPHMQIVWGDRHCYGVPFTNPVTGEVYERIVSVLELFLTEVDVLLTRMASGKDHRSRRSTPWS
jgi:hypothetical protein